MTDSAISWPVARNALAVYLNRRVTPKTRDQYLRHVGKLADYMEQQGIHSPADVKSRMIDEFLDDYGKTRAAKTVQDCTVALKRFFRYLLREGEIGDDPMLRVDPIPFDIEPQPTYIEDEIKRLLLVCPVQSNVGVRNHAIVLMLWDTGVRSSELVSMGRPDWDDRSIEVRQKHHLGEEATRRVSFGATTNEVLERYTRRWGIVDGSLWRGERGAMTSSGVHQLVDRLCDAAGIEPKGVHAFRRGAVCQMKRLGMNDSDIAELLGWSPTTAQIMIPRYAAALKDELAQLAHRRFSPGDALRSA